jgi:hypothetical protein
MGVSRDTGWALVVEVTNFRPTSTTTGSSVCVRGAGYPLGCARERARDSHSDVYKVTERYTPIDVDTIHHEATIEIRKYAAVEGRLLRVRTGAEGLRARRARVLRRERKNMQLMTAPTSVAFASTYRNWSRADRRLRE